MRKQRKLLFSAQEEASPEDLEFSVLCHRYAYYVLASPLISDNTYDEIERLAWKKCTKDHAVWNVGSSNENDYSDDIRIRVADER